MRQGAGEDQPWPGDSGATERRVPRAAEPLLAGLPVRRNRADSVGDPFLALRVGRPRAAIARAAPPGAGQPRVPCHGARPRERGWASAKHPNLQKNTSRRGARRRLLGRRCHFVPVPRPGLPAARRACRVTRRGRPLLPQIATRLGDGHRGASGSPRARRRTPFPPLSARDPLLFHANGAGLPVVPRGRPALLPAPQGARNRGTPRLAGASGSSL